MATPLRAHGRAAGVRHTAVVDPATGAVFACGDGYGHLWQGKRKPLQRLNGPSDEVSETVKVRPPPAAIVSVGNAHMAMLCVDGTVWTRGSNQFGQLGVRGTPDAPPPSSVVDGFVRVDLAAAGVPGGAEHRIVAVHAGFAGTTAVVTASGQVWACGEGVAGVDPAAPAAPDQHAEPHQVLRQVRPAAFTAPVADVALGGVLAVFVTRDGNVFTSGFDNASQTTAVLGRGSDAPRHAPTPLLVETLAGSVKAVAAAAGRMHGGVVSADGDVWMWGLNVGGQLGLGDTTARATPHKVPGLPPVQQLSAGFNHTVALCRDGRVFAWGMAGLGAEPSDSFPEPVEVRGIPDGFTPYSVSAGDFHTVIMVRGTAEGEEGVIGMVTFGRGTEGQLGDADRTGDAHPKPQLVLLSEAYHTATGDVSDAGAGAGAGAGSGAGAGAGAGAAAAGDAGDDGGEAGDGDEGEGGSRWMGTAEPEVWVALSFGDVDCAATEPSLRLTELPQLLEANSEFQSAAAGEPLQLVVCEFYAPVSLEPLRTSLPAVARMANLTHVSLDSCTLVAENEAAVSAVAEGLRGCPNLVCFSLGSQLYRKPADGVSYSPEGDDALLAALVRNVALLPQLQCLRVANAGTETATAAAAALASTSPPCQLRELVLHGGVFELPGFQALGDALAVNTVLRELALPHNFMHTTPAAARAIAEPGLASNTTLVKLDMRVAELGAEGVAPEGLGHIVEALERNDKSALGDLIVYSDEGPDVAPALATRLRVALSRNAHLVEAGVAEMPAYERREDSWADM